MSELIFKIIIFLILFTIGWLFGRYIEARHLRELDDKEQQLADIRMDSRRFLQVSSSGELISSSVVISSDYFKYVLAVIHNLLGKNLQSYESILERARREAIVRLKQQARERGANCILGVRLSTTELGMQGGMVEVFAYGTAINEE
ncbi:YbjQ family protein [Acinetobacter qingfengensis]|uniref:Metal-binding protein n=1 Tax=Acinetobacter qingfengensis TaxID=1262585 RepID=A0A1E7RF80_9GAMM|nr:heavy metal-binding domain-containing protein [Acinetobacter qingfengensis]KAA8731895.1 YbjQ family protein [Acinetobacter qingfengensis]OEY97981.1 metal-binding protein [Acinetobacter qingfengensis]